MKNRMGKKEQLEEKTILDANSCSTPHVQHANQLQ